MILVTIDVIAAAVVVVIVVTTAVTVIVAAATINISAAWCLTSKRKAQRRR